MKLSDRGYTLITFYEGCKLKAYKCPAGIWTIGYGHTGSDVYEGLVITKERALELLRKDIVAFEKDVVFLSEGHAMSQGEFDAMVSFAFNVGSDIDLDKIAEGLGDSTLLKKFLAGDRVGAADEFPKWNKAKGKVLPGLVNRRAAERELFLS